MMGRRQFFTGAVGALSAAGIVASDQKRSVRPVSSTETRNDPLVINGGVYAGFVPSEPWLEVEPQVALDSSRFGAGTNSLRMTSANGNPARADSLLSPPPTRLLQLDVYVEDPASCARLELLLSSNGFSGWLWLVTNNTQFVTGWNRLQFSVYDCQIQGTGMTLDDWNRANAIRLYFMSQPGATATVWLSQFKWLQTRAAITFTFDDGRTGCYTNALPMLQQYGWAATIYVVTEAIGQPSFVLAGSGDTMDPVSIDQLNALQDAGWDVSAHSCTHPDLTSLPSDQKRYEIENSKEWLLTNGFDQGSRFFATPYGRRDDETQSIVSSLYDNLRDAGTLGTVPGYETPLNMDWATNTRYRLRSQGLESRGQVDFAQFQSWVDAAIVSGTWLIVVGHSVDGPSGWLDPAVFRQFLWYLNLRRHEIDVLTMSQYWDRRNRHLADFSGPPRHRLSF